MYDVFLFDSVYYSFLASVVLPEICMIQSLHKTGKDDDEEVKVRRICMALYTLHTINVQN